MTVRFRRTSVMPSADVAVRQKSLRSHNLALVFRQVVAAGKDPISRAQIASATGLTRPTVSRIVDQLIAGRFIVEQGSTPYSGFGRPPVGLALSREGPAGLGLGIKAGQLAACVVDLTGCVRYLDVVECVSSPHQVNHVLTHLASMAKTAIETATAENMTISGIMVSVPGLVDQYHQIRIAATLGWRDIDIVASLRTALGEKSLPVAADNEANLAALGEFYADEDLVDFLYLSGEAEVGASTFINGNLLRGTRGWGGEIGHITIYPEGRECDCGLRGCLHSYASLGVLSENENSTKSTVTAADIAAWADAGVPTTLRALESAATALGIAVSNIVNYVDVNTVVLGGGYSLLASWLLDEIRRHVELRVPTNTWSPIDIRPSLLGADAAVIGAALTVIDEIRHRPPDWLLLDSLTS